MTSKCLLKFTLIFLVVIIMTASLSVFFAGIRLSVENQSQLPIENLKIDYGRGVLKIDLLAPRGSFKKYLGKIGEGADFVVIWNNDQNARFNIYFDGLLGYDKIRIVFLPSGQVLLFDNDKIYESVAPKHT